MGREVLIVSTGVVGLPQLLIAQGTDVVVRHVYFLLLRLKGLDNLIDLLQSSCELQLFDLDQSKSETYIFSISLKLLSQLEPTLGIGKHFLTLEQNSDVVNGYEEFRLQNESLFVAINSEYILLFPQFFFGF